MNWRTASAVPTESGRPPRQSGEIRSRSSCRATASWPPAARGLGYLGGLHRKRALLDLEQQIGAGQPRPAELGHRQLSLL
jgi:hypothetical protein